MQFYFHLNPVLKLRQEKEKEAVLKQAKAYKEYLRHMESLQATRNQLESAFQGGTAIGLFDALNALMYRDILKTKIAEEEQRAVTASNNLQKCRRDTLEARKQKLQLEKLKQNRFGKFVQEMNKREQKINDELATQISFWNK